MNRLDVWLGQATKHLSKNSADRVRSEIREHYEAAREAALGDGASDEEADGRAVDASGKGDDCEPAISQGSAHLSRGQNATQWE